MNVSPGTSVGGKQGFHLLAQLRIMATRVIQQGSALLRIAVGSAVKQFFDLRPTLRSDRHVFWTSLCSHASAILKSRRTVIGETLSAWAISS